MLRRLFNSCLLRPEEFQRSRDDLQVLGVFNPGADATSERVVLLVRVASTSRPDTKTSSCSRKTSLINTRRCIGPTRTNASPNQKSGPPLPPISFNGENTSFFSAEPRIGKLAVSAVAPRPCAGPKVGSH